MRLAPVRAEWYDEYPDPMDYANDRLPWNNSRWPDQLAALGPVEHLVIVINIPPVWPPVPDEEEAVMSRWTSKLISTGSNLDSIKIQYHNEQIRYTRSRWELSYGRYINLLLKLPLPPYLEGRNFHAMRYEGEIISEEELLWVRTSGGWSRDVELFY
ncbi:hypothetical protein HWV62_34207 [Athelia sp. TMB]|nr:hypothetical protein HWV62_34207 [Athelia sp. TMB]